MKSLHRGRHRRWFRGFFYFIDITSLHVTTNLIYRPRKYMYITGKEYTREITDGVNSDRTKMILINSAYLTLRSFI